MPATNSILAAWNRLEPQTAVQTILPCNGSQAWASGIADLRPFESPDELFDASDKVWQSLPEADQQQAFDSHPRLGESKAKSATPQSLAWSAVEQSAGEQSAGEQSTAQFGEATQSALAAANRTYEARFGRIFILCATGRTANEILANLQRRLDNDAATELREAAEQQRLITQLRLRKWLQLPAPTCAELAANDTGA